MEMIGLARVRYSFVLAHDHATHRIAEDRASLRLADWEMCAVAAVHGAIAGRGPPIRLGWSQINAAFLRL